mgnify:CR=1 FL=1
MTDQFHRLLMRVQKPARYVGGEYNQIIKDKKDVDVRVAFCFPDTYEIGMSNIGMRILYGVMNEMSGVWCERVFAPWGDMEDAMRANGIPLYALESGDPVSEFDLIAFTIGYEMAYSNILNMLNLAGVPLRSKDRRGLKNIVFAGGVCAFNPEPLAGFIAFSIADRPGLTPGLIGGMLAVSGGSGFIGGIISGFLAGYVAKLISTKLKLPQSMEALKPILIIPLVSSLIVGLAMIYLIGKPVAGILAWLTHWLQTMGTANAVLLGAILGAMMCTDMGGPVNKAAYAFGVGLLSTQTYAPMAAIMAAGMVPPLAMGIATLVARNKFDKGQREGGKAALVLGLCFISEGAIPFAARDPMRVLPCCIVGGAVTGAISMAVGAKLMAPHGGLFVLLIPGAITPVLGYLLAIVAGTLVAGLAYAVLKRPEAQTAEVEKAA